MHVKEIALHPREIHSVVGPTESWHQTPQNEDGDQARIMTLTSETDIRIP